MSKNSEEDALSAIAGATAVAVVLSELLIAKGLISRDEIVERLEEFIVEARTRGMGAMFEAAALHAVASLRHASHPS